MKFLAFCLLPIALFADAKVNAEFYGFITLLPPFIAIILAFITKDVILSLFMGVLSGTFLLSLASNIFFVDTIALINIYDT